MIGLGMETTEGGDAIQSLLHVLIIVAAIRSPGGCLCHLKALTIGLEAAHIHERGEGGGGCAEAVLSTVGRVLLWWTGAEGWAM